MATSLPPPGASRPRPPLAPPSSESRPLRAPTPPPPPGDGAGARAGIGPGDDDAVDVPSWVAPGLPRLAARPGPVASAPTARVTAATTVGTAPGEDDQLPDAAAIGAARDRSWGAARWILLIGFSLVAVALGVIANQAWLMGLPQSWVWWSSIAVVPPGLTALAALFGWRLAPFLAVAASVCTAVMAAVGLLRQPPVGLPQAVCAIAAVAVTLSARAVAKPAQPAPLGGDVSGVQPAP